MHPSEKRLWDILVIAGWVENVGTGQPGKREVRWAKGNTPLDGGQAKLILFSALFRELSKGGPISDRELRLLCEMGWALMPPQMPDLGPSQE